MKLIENIFSPILKVETAQELEPILAGVIEARATIDVATAQKTAAQQPCLSDGPNRDPVESRLSNARNPEWNEKSRSTAKKEGATGRLMAKGGIAEIEGIFTKYQNDRIKYF